LNIEHLHRAEAFYARHGGKTIILARFMPIIRTFAPFVAGMSRMDYRRFFFFNMVGGIVWVALFVAGGYFVGNIPAVKHNFEYVILGIIFVSFLPPIYEVAKEKLAKRRAHPIE
jgi:membrane-associated protein